MSSVRMCDPPRGCGKIFSENDDGWTTFTGSIQRRREDGSRFTERAELDVCAECSSPAPAPAPKNPQALVSSNGGSDTTALEDENRDLRIGALEREIGELRANASAASMSTATGQVIIPPPVAMPGDVT